MTVKYDLKNLWHGQPSNSNKSPKALELVRARASETLSKLKKAIAHSAKSRPAANTHVDTQAVNLSARRLLQALNDVDNLRIRPAPAQSFALSATLKPLFTTWDAESSSLKLGLTDTKAILKQIRDVLDRREAQLCDALKGVVLREPRGTPLHARAMNELSQLAQVAINAQVRRSISNLGIVPQKLDSLVTPSSPLHALEMAQRLAKAQKVPGAPQPRAAGRRKVTMHAPAPGIGGASPIRAPQPLPATAREATTINIERLRMGSKERIDQQAYRHLRLTQGRFSILSSRSGESWVMNASRGQGGFGKFRIGVTDHGEAVAIKEFRLRAKAGHNPAKTHRTRASSVEEILGEVKLTMRLRTQVEKYMAQYDAPGNRDTLRGVRSGTTPFQMYDIIEVPQKGASIYRPRTGNVHVPMTLDSGGISALSAKLTSDSGRALAGVSLAAQGFTELGILHDVEQHIHRDLSLGNIFFNGKGQMRIMDFGLASPIDARGFAPTSGVVGTNYSPEMVDMMGQSRASAKLNSTAQDVFAMGICVAQLAAGIKVRNPFLLMNVLGKYANSHEHASAVTFNQAFARWLQEHRGLDGRVDARLIRPDAPQGKDPYGFGRFFYNLSTHPKLFDLVVNQAMAIDPNNRPKASHLAAAARALTPAVNSRAARSLVGAIAEVDRALGVDVVVREAETFRTWEAQTRATRNAPRFGRGEVRPLP